MGAGVPRPSHCFCGIFSPVFPPAGPAVWLCLNCHPAKAAWWHAQTLTQKTHQVYRPCQNCFQTQFEPASQFKNTPSREPMRFENKENQKSKANTHTHTYSLIHYLNLAFSREDLRCHEPNYLKTKIVLNLFCTCQWDHKSST